MQAVTVSAFQTSQNGSLCASDLQNTQRHIALALVRCIEAHTPIAVSNNVLRHFDITQRQIEAREMYLHFQISLLLYVTARIFYLFPKISSTDLVIYSSRFSRKYPSFMGFKELCSCVPQIRYGKRNMPEFLK